MRGVVVALLLTALAGCSRTEAPPAPKFLATDITGVPWGRDFRLTDHTGRVRTLADFRGKVVALFFGYTHCPDVCPTTLSDFAMAIRELGAAGDSVQVLFVTLDPERDTPELLARYVPSFHPRFLGLHTDPATLAQLTREFKVVYQKNAVQGPAGYLIDHSAGTYVFDKQGKLRLYIAYGSGPRTIAQDLRTLLAQK